MYQEPIFLESTFHERIWGGQKLHTLYGYNIPYDKTGEAWVISAHPNGPSTITNGPLAGKTLADAWKEHGELFNKQDDHNEAYPLLIKILDANDDLSVQVHPDDTFAQEVEGQPYGKTECWYVLSAEPGAEIVLGHHANTKEELERMMDNEEWDKLLKHVSVKAGDFIYVPSGTIHAIGKGIVILETQQSSDITYRVYDYDRVGATGQKRELHLEQAKEVTTVPHQQTAVDQREEHVNELTIKQLVEAQYFSVYRWELNGTAVRKLDQDFLQVSVIDGNATIVIDGKTFDVGKGDHFILPSTIEEYELHGHATIVVSHT
ncbi:mannose-6-phosphate isomerase, class I [Virgibacillus sp. FSP13]